MPKTVLVVEDEVFIRIDISDYLREEGFDVLEAADARQALTLLKARGSVDLVFTDVQMPGEMDGIGLARFLAANYPTIKIVVTSGHVRAHEIPKFGPFVDKPYDRRMIVQRINEALAHP